MVNQTAIVVPCFNEDHRFPMQYWRDLVHEENGIQWFFVNDGSSDKTSNLLQDLIKDSSAEVIHNPRNMGKGNSIREGFIHALKQNSKYKSLGYMDSDGAFSKRDLFCLIGKFEELELSNKKRDAILSSRVALAGHQINRNPSRHYIGRIIATYLTRNWVDAPYDTQSGLKLFANSISFQNAIDETFKTSWFVDIEILTRIGIENGGNLSLWEEPLTSWSDVAGSKLDLKHTPKLFREIFVARKEVSKLIKSRGLQSGSH